MKLKFLLIIFFLLAVIKTQAQHKKLNMIQLSHWDDDSIISMGLQSFNDVWGWYDSVKKREYAIVGTVDSTYFFDVTNPFKRPVKCDAEAGKSGFSIWRDYDTYGHYCYAVQDAGRGSLQIFDLSYLPDSVQKVYDSDSLVYRAHTIFRAGDKLYCNTVTTNFGTRRAMQILSLQNPEKPVLAGVLTPPIFGGTPAFGFCHDTYVRNDTAYCSGENAGLFIFDVKQPANARFLASITDYAEKGYNHSSWISGDGKNIFFTDENIGLGLKVYDISDFNNIEFQTIFRSNTGAVAHNPYIRDHFLFVSYYEDGVYMYDIRNPKSPKLVAYYDTHPQNAEGQYRGFYGCWAVYPFLPSGIVLALDQTNGLFVLKADNDVSVDEIGVEDFKVYPNPLNNNKLHINIINQNEKEIQVKISTITGALVYSQTYNLESGINNIETEVPQHMQQGIYFVSISGRISNICKKIQKQ